MSAEIEEIKEKLRQMRKENRSISTQNRELSWQITQIHTDIQQLQEKHQQDLQDFENRMRLETKQIEIEIFQRTQQRKDRRREVLSEVRKQAESNKSLASQIKAIENEIARVKDIQESYPSKFIQQKALARKRRRPTARPTL